MIDANRCQDPYDWSPAATAGWTEYVGVGQGGMMTGGDLPYLDGDLWMRTGR